MKSKRRILNVTHTDLDGTGCPIVLKVLFPEYEVVPYYCDYNNINDVMEQMLDKLKDDSSVDYLFITDISFRKESGIDERITEMNTMGASARVSHSINTWRGTIYMYDHHPSSNYANNYPWGHSSEEDDTGLLTCGTKWIYKALTTEQEFEDCRKNDSKKLHEFVELVNDWDTWRWITDYPEGSPNKKASDLNSVRYMYGKTKFVDDYVNKINSNSEIFGSGEQSIIECKQIEIDSDIKHKENELYTTKMLYVTRKSQLPFIENYLANNHIDDMEYLKSTRYKHTFNVGVIFLSRNISEVGNALAAAHPELDFIAIINLPYSISLRAVKDLKVPLGIIANYLTNKGGGHVKSAGSVLKKCVSDDIIQYVMSLYRR